MKQVILTRSEIKLIQLRMRDADSLFALTNESRTYLEEWLPWVRPTKTVEDTKKFIQYSLKGKEIAGMHFGIWRDMKLVGVIGFHSIDQENKKATIGYWLGQDYQGKGVMTRACEMLVSYGFQKEGLNRIEIECGVGNYKSSRIPKRLGFVLEGVSRQAHWVNDHFVDLEIYSMLKTDWTEKLGKV